MKNLIVFLGLVTLSFSALAGGPKTSVIEVIKNELQKSNFIGQFGETGELLVQLRIESSGAIVIEGSNSENDKLIGCFSEFIKTIRIESDQAVNQEFNMRFVFKKY